MGKMYYSEEEAAAKLGGPESLQELVDEGKLMPYMDGGRRMYKAADIDAAAPGSEDSQGIELTPADSTDEPMSLAGDSVADQEAKKEDTVITSDGISIFDDEDLELASGSEDPMAKTAITPSVEEEILMEGGSGLTRLAEEKDDTSLGDALDQIPEADYFPGEGELEDLSEVEVSAEDLGPDELAETGAPMPAGRAAPAVMEPTIETEMDPSAGLFAGLLLACTLLMLLAALVAVPVIMGSEPSYLAALQQNILMVLAAAVVVSLAAAVVGYFLGQSAARRAEALRVSGPGRG